MSAKPAPLPEQLCARFAARLAEAEGESGPPLTDFEQRTADWLAELYPLTWAMVCAGYAGGGGSVETPGKGGKGE